MLVNKEGNDRSVWMRRLFQVVGVRIWHEGFPVSRLINFYTFMLHYENKPILNILKSLPPKNENFQMKNSDIFSSFCSQHRLLVLVRTASTRRF